MPRLSIITVTWNHADEIREYARAVAEAAKSVDLELVIVDNDSRDGTADLIAAEFPWVRLVRSGGNLGFAAGCNVGLEAASGEYLLLLNPDAGAEAAALNGMMEFLGDAIRQGRPVGAVGCLLYHDDGLPQQSAFPSLTPLAYVTHHSMVYPLWEAAKKVCWQLGFRDRAPREVGWLQGSCLMVPREVYRKVGGLDPSYFIYCEDSDWCERIRAAGFSVMFLSQFRLFHRQKSSTRKAPEYTFRRVYRSIVHFANLHRRGWAHRAIIWTMLVDMHLRLPAYWLQGMLKPARAAALAERRASVRRLIAILRTRNPDLFPDDPPR